MSDLNVYILCALAQFTQLSIGQLSHFLFDTGLIIETDLKPPLALLKDKEMVCQVVNLQGIVYEITDAGRTYINNNTALTHIKTDIEAKSVEFQRIFEREKNYLAQYTEQSSGIVPVFLSIRDGNKIVLKISIIVNDVDTAKKICSGWIKNSGQTYDVIWQAIAGGEPDPGLWTGRQEEEAI